MFTPSVIKNNFTQQCLDQTLNTSNICDIKWKYNTLGQFVGPDNSCLQYKDGTLSMAACTKKYNLSQNWSYEPTYGVISFNNDSQNTLTVNPTTGVLTLEPRNTKGAAQQWAIGGFTPYAFDDPEGLDHGDLVLMKNLGYNNYNVRLNLADFDPVIYKKMENAHSVYIWHTKDKHLMSDAAKKKCLTAVGDQTDVMNNNAMIIEFDCRFDDPNQMFNYLPETKQIQSVSDPKFCIDAINGKPRMYTCDLNTSSQFWRLGGYRDVKDVSLPQQITAPAASSTEESVDPIAAAAAAAARKKAAEARARVHADAVAAANKPVGTIIKTIPDNTVYMIILLIIVALVMSRKKESDEPLPVWNYHKVRD